MALRWLTEQKARSCFSVTVEFSVCIPRHRPRRGSGVRRRLSPHRQFEIPRKLISGSWEGEESVLREHLQQPAVANLIAHLRERLPMPKTSTAYVTWKQKRPRIIGAHGVKFQYCFHAKTQDVYLVTGCSLAVGTLQLRAGRAWL